MKGSTYTDVVRFVVTNKGKVMHEMVLGTMDDLKKHAEMMRKHPEIEHDEPHMAMSCQERRVRWAGSSPRQASSTTAAWFQATLKPA
jgi:hypothetical protein